MNRLFKHVACSLALLILLTSPQNVSAHAGGGPPFLKVNGKYAQTNPYYISQPSFAIPLDYTQDSFLPNDAIEFIIDSANLGVPEEIVKQSNFQWQFEKNAPYEYGLQKTHTYTKVGSYIVTLEVKGPNEADYIILDSLQINVVPEKEYALPKVFIRANSEKGVIGKPFTFTADATHDKNTDINKYEWDFGDKSTKTEKIQQYSFTGSDIYQPIYVQVTDKNGLTAQSGLAVTSVKDQITLVALVPQNITTSSKEKTTPAPNNGKPYIKTQIKSVDTPFSQIVFVLLVVIGAIILVIAGKKFIKKKNT